MTRRYLLEIYEPGSAADVWITFESDAPFGCMHSGNILNNYMLPNSASDETILVSAIEHLLWTSEGMTKHKLLVYTSRSYGDPEGLRK